MVIFKGNSVLKRLFTFRNEIHFTKHASRGKPRCVVTSLRNRSIIVKNVRRIPETETIQKVTKVVRAL